MKLYHQDRTRSARVLWLLHELGMPCEIQRVDVFSGEGRRPEYQAVHPHGFVPALEDDGVVLIESSAICMYLADKHGTHRLAPAVGTPARGKYYEWMVYIPATADPCLETIMFHTMFLPEEKRLPQLVEKAKKTWSRVEKRFATSLGGSEWALGETFSAADVVLGSALAWAKMAGVFGGNAPLADYFERASSRPAFKTAYGG